MFDYCNVTLIGDKKDKRKALKFIKDTDSRIESVSNIHDGEDEKFRATFLMKDRTFGRKRNIKKLSRLGDFVVEI